MSKKILFLGIVILGLMVMGASCSSTPASVEPNAIGGGEEILEEEEEPEVLQGEIGEDEQRREVLIGEVDPTEEMLNINVNSNIYGEEPEEPVQDVPVRAFNMIAKQYEFVPEVIKVKKNNKVILNIQSEDIEHGFAIDEYDINETIPAGENITIEFIADKVGKFNFYCSIYCGIGHSNMSGQLIVE